LNILLIPVYTKNIDFASKLILKGINNKLNQNAIITATSAHGLVLSMNDSILKKVLQSSFLNLPDGMPLVWIGRLKNSKNMVRCYGPEFFREVIIATKNQNINHFLCGGQEGVAEELKKVCEDKFGNRNICGVYSPSFREMTEDELQSLANEINSKDTNIVWIGLSTPKQEIFAYRLSKYTNVNFLCTVGAAFDFHTGRVRQAPKIIQKIGMEWFFRLLMEPQRLWKRYFKVVPLFIWYNIVDILNGEFFQNTVKAQNEK